MKRFFNSKSRQCSFPLLIFNWDSYFGANNQLKGCDHMKKVLFNIVCIIAIFYFLSSITVAGFTAQTIIEINPKTAFNYLPIMQVINDENGAEYEQLHADTSLDKSASPKTYSKAGDLITYTFAEENTGDISLFNVTIDDPLVTMDGGPITELAIEAKDSKIFTATYELPKADVDSGSVNNPAIVNAVDPIEGPFVYNRCQFPEVQDANISLEKSASPATYTYSDLGEEITYTFTLKNTGNVTLTDVAVTELTFSGTGILPAPDFVSSSQGSAEGTLLAGEIATYEAIYTIVAGDLELDSIYNEARATGTPPVGDAVTDDDDETVEYIEPDAPSINLEKSASPATYTYSDLGEEITYTFLVENTGNVTLTDVAVTELTFSGTGTLPAPDFVSSSEDSSEGLLLPGEIATYEAIYTIVAGDLELDSIDNEARATGTPPVGDAVTDDDDETVEYVAPVAPSPSISLDKSASPSTYSKVGDEITYTFTVENTGNVTLTDVAVIELTFSGNGTLPAPDFVSSSEGSSEGLLLAGEIATYEATYTIVTADLELDSIDNVARASGTYDGDDYTDDNDETVDYVEDPSLPPTPPTDGIVLALLYALWLFLLALMFFKKGVLPQNNK